MHCRHLRARGLFHSQTGVQQLFCKPGRKNHCCPIQILMDKTGSCHCPPLLDLVLHTCANSTARETKETTDKLVAKDRLAARHKMMIEGQLDIRAAHAKVWLGRNYWSFRRKRFPTFAHFCNVGHIQLRSA